MVLNAHEAYVVVFQVPIYAVYMVVVPVFGIVKHAGTGTEEVFVHDDVSQANVKRNVVQDVKKDVGINEQKLVDISFDLDTIVEDIKKEVLF